MHVLHYENPKSRKCKIRYAFETKYSFGLVLYTQNAYKQLQVYKTREY